MTTLSSIESVVLYLIVYGLSSLCVAYNDRFLFAKRKKTIIFLFIGLILPVMLAAYRVNVGTDYGSYLYLYKSMGPLTLEQLTSNYNYLSSGAPIGMRLVAKISSIFGSERLFFGILAALSLIPFLLFIRRSEEIEHKGIATFMYLFSNFTTGFNATKQIIAISIILCGFSAVYHRKITRFIVIVATAALFHQTALVALPIYFIFDKNKRISTGKRFFIITAAFIVLALSDNILVLLGSRWENYTRTYGTSNLTFYLYLGWLIIFLWFRKALIKRSYKNEMSIILFAIGLIMTLLGFWSVSGKRIALYFTVSEILLISQFPETVNAHSKLIVEILIVLYALFMFILSAAIIGHAHLVPYSF